MDLWGGYASLLFAIDMGLKGAIAVHPQITYKATRKHTANDWESQIRKCGSQFYDLTDFLFKRKTLPHFYIEYGEYEADRECAEEFLDKLRLVEVLTIFKKTSNKKHVTSNPSYDNINNIISLFEKFDMDG